MFCENCGKPLGENAKFCAGCGAKNPAPEAPAAEATAVMAEVAVEAPAAEVPAAEPTVAEAPAAAAETPAAEPTVVEIPRQDTPISFGADAEPPMPKKKRGKKLLTVAIVAVVLAVAVAVSAFASPFVGNLIARTFRSPEGYLGYVVNNSTEDFAEEFAAQFALVKNVPTAAAGSADITFTMGEGMKKLLNEAGGSEAEMITSWVNSVGVGLNAAMDGTDIGLNARMSLNGSELISGDIVMDGENEMMYISVPEISETGIGISLGSEYSYMMESQKQAMEMMTRMMDILPDEDALVKMICRYMEVVTAQVADVEKDTETLQAGTVSQKATVLTAEISEKTLMDIAEAVCKEARNDEEIETIIKKAAEIEEFGMDGGEVYSEFKDAIDAFLDDMDGYDASKETICELKVYVNNNGEIIGIGMEVEEEGVELSFYTVEKGSNSGTALKVIADGSEIIFEGESERTGGKYSGTYDLLYNDMKLAVVTLSNIDDAKLQEGMLDGTVSITLSDGLQNMLNMYDADAAALLKDARLDLTFTQESAADAGVEIAVHTDGTLFASLKMDVAADGSGTVNPPATYIDGEDEQELQAWLANAKLAPKDLINKLRAAGMPETLASQLEAAVTPAAEPEGVVLPGGEGTGIVDPRAAQNDFVLR